MEHVSKKLHQLNHALGTVLGREQLRQMSQIARIQQQWPSLIGALLAEHSMPTHIQQHCLHILIDHPIAAQQLRSLEKPLLAALKQRCDAQLLTVKTKLGKLKRSPKKENISLRRLRYHELKTIAQSLSSIHDKKLRRLMFRARSAQAKNQQHLDS